MSERPDSPQRSNVAAASACTGRGNNSGSPKSNVRLSTRRRAADARQDHDSGATIQAITERASGITFMVVIHKAPSDSRLRPQ
jgi:hypothetical protein